jgi:predicted GH43/DUF377 family glycosyl hydrolase
MLRRLFTHRLLGPEDLPPSSDTMEIVGIFNPGAGVLGDSGSLPGGEVVLLVRVAERPRHSDPGCTALPRYEEGRLVIDQVPNEELEPVDPRVVRMKRDRSVRLTSVSHLRVVRSKDGRTIDSVDNAWLLPASEYECFGLEDPRMSRIDGRHYFTYVAVSRHGAATALASTTDFITFERHGIIFCPENKDVLLFPERIRGRHCAIHRPNPATHFCPPEMWLAWSDDLVHWGRHQPLLGSGSFWSAGRVGGGCPPIRTEKGWLEIYHGNDRTPNQGGVGAYCAAAFLMDLEEPSRILGHSEGPILAPEEDFEVCGFLRDVIFPTALVEDGDTLLVYYGAADSCTGVVGIDRHELLARLRIASGG